MPPWYKNFWRNAERENAKTWRCPECLCLLSQDEFEWRCVEDCQIREAPREFSEPTNEPNNPSNFSSSPTGQRYRCPKPDCANMLTAPYPKTCDSPFAEPIALPPKRRFHHVVVAIDGKRITASLAIAACHFSLNRYHSISAGNASTKKVLKNKLLRAGMQNAANDSPAHSIIIAPKFPNQWPFYFYAHGYVPSATANFEENLRPRGCNGSGTSIVDRIACADSVMLCVSAAGILDRSNRDRIAERAVELSEALGRRNCEELPGLWVTLVDGDAFISRCGTGAENPCDRPVSDFNDGQPLTDAKFSKILYGYVFDSARLSVLLAPLLAMPWEKTSAGIIGTNPGDHFRAFAGLATWISFVGKRICST